MGEHKRASTKSKRALHRAPSRPKTAVEGAQTERERPKKRPDAALWGSPPDGATRFSLNRQTPSGGTEKLGLKGEDGVIKYNFPISVLSIDWVREYWRAGSFQANWLVEEDGKLKPHGRSRVVELDNVHAPARGPRATPVSIGVAGEQPHYPPPLPPPATMPPDVVDMRVRAAEEIAAMRIRTERELAQQRLDFEREQSERRFAQMEQRIEDLAGRPRRRDDDDDDDGPGEWDWLKDLAQQFAPALKQLVPVILAKLGGGNALPGGG